MEALNSTFKVDSNQNAFFFKTRWLQGQNKSNWSRMSTKLKKLLIRVMDEVDVIIT
jgi:hypothetical protein